MVFWWIYNGLLPLGLLLSLPGQLLKMIRRGQPLYCWRERFGFYGNQGSTGGEPERPLWIHAVSVGEVKMAAELAREIQRRCPDQPLVLSTTTITGRRLAESLSLPGCRVIFHPCDLIGVVHRAVSTLRPRMVILMEQELWPNLLFVCRSRGVPVWLVNARLSDRSARRFVALREWVRPVLGWLDFIGVNSEADLERFRECGFPHHRLFVTGSMKFDVVPRGHDLDGRGRIMDLPRKLGWGEDDPVLVCGSTHPGEEDLMVDAFARVRGAGFPRCRLLLVPRHAERASKIRERLSDRGWGVRLRSRAGESASAGPVDICVVDTTGELVRLYGLGTVNTIGKSFCGTGGQNFLEAVPSGKPVVVGPEMSNFQSLVEMFLEAKAIIQLSDGTSLAGVWIDLLSHPEKGRVMGMRAVELFEGHCGGVRKQAEMICTQVGSNH